MNKLLSEVNVGDTLLVMDEQGCVTNCNITKIEEICSQLTIPNTNFRRTIWLNKLNTAELFGNKGFECSIDIYKSTAVHFPEQKVILATDYDSAKQELLEVMKDRITVCTEVMSNIK